MARIPLIKFIGKRATNARNIISETFSPVENQVRNIVKSISAVKSKSASLLESYFINRVVLSQEEIDCISVRIGSKYFVDLL